MHPAAGPLAPRPIFLDHPATTPVDRRVVDTATPYLTEHFGHVAGRHTFGHTAAAAATEARYAVAILIDATPGEIVIVSVMHATNETGTIHSLATHSRGLVSVWRMRSRRCWDCGGVPWILVRNPAW